MGAHTWGGAGKAVDAIPFSGKGWEAQGSPNLGIGPNSVSSLLCVPGTNCPAVPRHTSRPVITLFLVSSYLLSESSYSTINTQL